MPPSPGTSVSVKRVPSPGQVASVAGRHPSPGQVASVALRHPSPGHPMSTTPSAAPRVPSPRAGNIVSTTSPSAAPRHPSPLGHPVSTTSPSAAPRQPSPLGHPVSTTSPSAPPRLPSPLGHRMTAASSSRHASPLGVRASANAEAKVSEGSSASQQTVAARSSPSLAPRSPSSGTRACRRHSVCFGTQQDVPPSGATVSNVTVKTGHPAIPTWKPLMTSKSHLAPAGPSRGLPSSPVNSRCEILGDRLLATTIARYSVLANQPHIVGKVKAASVDAPVAHYELLGNEILGLLDSIRDTRIARSETLGVGRGRTSTASSKVVEVDSLDALRAGVATLIELVHMTNGGDAGAARAASTRASLAVVQRGLEALERCQQWFSKSEHVRNTSEKA